MRDMKIAVLMSTYNGEKYIIEQIESILAQKCEMDFDLWVRDDGSTDSTVDILNKYQAEGKLKWYSGENLKPAKSFMDLIMKCRGYDFYAFADQDDYWYSNKLQRGINAIKEMRSEALYFSNARLVDDKLSYLGRFVYRHKIHCDFYSLVISGGVLGCTVMFNRNIADRMYEAGVPDKITMHDCYAALVCSIFDGEIIYDNEPTLDYRQHSNNVVGSQSGKVGALKDRIRKIFKPAYVSIAEQASSVLKIFENELSDEKKQWLMKVSEYRNSFANALKLAFSRKPKYNSKNMAVTLRFSILMRKH